MNEKSELHGREQKKYENRKEREEENEWKGQKGKRVKKKEKEKATCIELSPSAS